MKQRTRRSALTLCRAEFLKTHGKPWGPWVEDRLRDQEHVLAARREAKALLEELRRCTTALQRWASLADDFIARTELRDEEAWEALLPEVSEARASQVSSILRKLKKQQISPEVDPPWRDAERERATEGVNRRRLVRRVARHFDGPDPDLSARDHAVMSILVGNWPAGVLDDAPAARVLVAETDAIRAAARREGVPLRARRKNQT